MSSSATVTLVSNWELEKLFQNRTDLKKGDKLEGKILEVRDNGKAVIDFGNFQAEVDLKFPVEKGDLIHLVVVETGKQLKLKIEQVESQTQQEVTNLLKEGNVQQEKSLEELTARINQLLQKELKNLEAGHLDKSVHGALEDIGRELSKLKEHVQGRPGQEVIPKETRQEIEQLLKTLENTLQHIPETTSSEVSQRLENLAKALGELRTGLEGQRHVREWQEHLLKEVSTLKSEMEELKLPEKKELETLINKLSDTVSKVEVVSSGEQREVFRGVIDREMAPQLRELREALDNRLETVARDSKHYGQLQALRQRVENLEKALQISLPELRENPPDIEVLVNNLEKALDKVSDAQSGGNDLRKFPIATETWAEIRTGINAEVTGLKEVLEGVTRRETLNVETKQRMQELLERVETTLKELPGTGRNQTAGNTEQLSSLFKEIHTLRTTLDAQRDFQELQERIVQEVARLKTLAEELEGPAAKEVEAVIQRLTATAEKIKALEGPEQLPELRQLVKTELAADLKVLEEVAGKQGDHSSIAIAERAAQLQRDVRITMERMPDSLPALNKLEPLFQKVELTLNGLPEGPQRTEKSPEIPHFSEDIQSIYENIKKALRLLQNNLQISGDQLEIPEQIRQVFLNLQSDLKAADASANVLEQITRLKEMITKADLPIEKVVKEILDSLNEMMQRIGELKEQHNFNEIRQLVQNRLGPQLKMIGELFGNERLLGLLEGRDQVSAVSIRNAVREVQEAIESAFLRGESAGASSELTQFMEITTKLANLPGVLKGEGAMTQNAETIAQLSKNIEEFLARLPNTPNVSEGGSASLVDKIKGLLSTLQAHFEPLDLGQETLNLVPRLKALVENSGVFFEKKLGDILDKLTDASAKIQEVRNLEQLHEIRSIIEKDMKPNLLQLREHLTDERLLSQMGDAKNLENIRASVQDLLSQIGSQQERAAEQFNQQSQMQLFSFHVPIKDEEPAELKVFYNRGRKKDSPEEFKLSLLLDMSKLGEIRSDFFNVKDDLSITFYVGNERIKDFFQDHLDELTEVLEPVFEHLHMNIIVSQEKAMAFDNAEPLEANEQIISSKAVNIKI